ncbi:MAG: V-type ATPase 116kDa subunit family protein, partial [Thermoprotei archaeon]
MSVLHDMGVLQVENLSKDVAPLVSEGVSAELTKHVSEELLRIRGLRLALPPKPVSKIRFTGLDHALKTASSISVDKEVSDLLSAREELLTAKSNLSAQLQLLRRISFIDTELSVLSLDSATPFAATGEPARVRAAVGELESKLKLVYRALSEGRDSSTAVVVVRNEELEKFGSTIQSLGLRFQRIPDLQGTPIQEASLIEEKLKKIGSELDSVSASLDRISTTWYSELAAVEEQLAIELKKLEVSSKLGYTENLVVLEGWVPEENVAELSHALAQATANTTFVYDSPSSETPPTLMKNPKRVSLFESFVRFYSLPQAEEIDPTLIYSIFFPFFFGFMIGDVGYGVVILLISLWIRRHVTHSGKSIVPGSLRRFGRTILRPTAWLKVANAMMIGSIVAIFFGFLFNEYFGFNFNAQILGPIAKALGVSQFAGRLALDPISSFGLKKLLLFSGYVGLFLVCFGFGLGALNSYWEHNIKHT